MCKQKDLVLFGHVKTPDLSKTGKYLFFNIGGWKMYASSGYLVQKFKIQVSTQNNEYSEHSQYSFGAIFS